MKVRFWGVRGSLPTPLSPSQVKSKISAVVQRIRASDITSPEAREKFLSSLPPDLFGTVGGNTPCIEVQSDLGSCIVFDAGTGIREFGLELIREKSEVRDFHIFWSHFHWDHIQGLPFFPQAFNPNNRLRFYSPVEEFEKIVKDQMRHPNFPVEMDVMRCKKEFLELRGPLNIAGAIINYRKMSHPGGCYSYSVSENGHKVIYATDAELGENDFKKSSENQEYFANADLLIIDSQYTLGEAIEKYNWGHSSFSMAVDFASNWGIKNIVLFHHEPSYSDRKLFTIFNEAEWYLDHLEEKSLKVYLAVEGMELTFG